MKCVFAAVSIMISLSSFGWASESKQETRELKARKDRISYSVGFQIGGDFVKEKTEVDSEAFLRGVKDALAKKDPEVGEEEMRSILLEMKKRIVTRQRFEKLEMREQRLGEGKRFLAENAREEGVITLASGMQYKVIKKGTGKMPGPTDMVTVHYRSRLLDGTEFGNSYRKGAPETFYVSAVIQGVSQALQLMREGAEWQVFIPADLAYGDRGPLADRTVICDLKLISVESPE